MLPRQLIRLFIVLMLALPVTTAFAQEACSDIEGCQGALGLPQSVLDAYPKPNVKTLPYPAAWTMKHLRPASVPGGDDDPNNPFMYRYTLVNLYTYVEVDGKRWYQVGTNQWIHQYNVAKITPIAKPEGIDTHKWVA